MIFSPPNCIKSMSTVCPFWVKYVAVSTTIKPVTQLALMEVNRASKNGIYSICDVISGIINKPVPIKIRKINEEMSILGGLIFNNVKCVLAFPSSIPTNMKK